MKLLLRVHSDKARPSNKHRKYYSPASSGLRGNNNNANQDQKKCIDWRNIQTWIMLFILIGIVIGAGQTIYTLTMAIPGVPETPPREILFGNNYEDGTIPNLGNGHLVIDRKQWGAAPTSKPDDPAERLDPPIPIVIITHIGVQSKPCDNVYNCSVKMRTIQDSAIAEKKLSDMPANFYVSSDGYIYVGRGWKMINAYFGRSLAVCFMGDYIRYEPTAKQFSGVQHLLAYGVAEKLLAPGYLVVAHNQTKSTKSPGSHVYKEIRKWPRWSSCGTANQPKCEI